MAEVMLGSASAAEARHVIAGELAVACDGEQEFAPARPVRLGRFNPDRVAARGSRNNGEQPADEARQRGVLNKHRLSGSMNAEATRLGLRYPEHAKGAVEASAQDALARLSHTHIQTHVAHI